MGKRSVPLEVRRDIASALASGRSVSSVAAEFGATVHLCQDIKARRGKLPTRKAADLSKLEIAEMCRTYEAKNSIREISIQFGVTNHVVTQVLRAAKVPIRSLREAHNTYTFDRRFFENIGGSEAAAYWAGFIAADGCVGSFSTNCHALRIGLAPKDRGHLELFLRHIGGTQSVRETRRPNGSLYVYVEVGSMDMIEDLERWGIVPRKTFTIRWPDLPDEAARHFLRGYMDGDGCWHTGTVKRETKRHGTVEQRLVSVQIVSNEAFLNGAQEFIGRATGIQHRLLRSYAHSPIKCLSISAWEDARELARFLYGGATVYMPRKQKKAQQIINQHPPYYTVVL